MYLRNTVALITGGAQGFGKGFARVVLNGGGKVSILDVKEDVGRDTVHEFNTQFGAKSSLFIKCDVRNKLDVNAAFRKTSDVFGTINLVVNNAGVMTTDDWERTIDINLKGVMHVCFAAVEYMSSKKPGCHGGHIINISSAAGLTATPFDPAYAASKHGVVGLSRSLALMLESESIRVNCLCPTFAETELFRSSLDAMSDSAQLQQLSARMGIMSVDEVVTAFKQLLDDTYMTGAVLLVNKSGITYRHKPRPVHPPAKL